MKKEALSTRLASLRYSNSKGKTIPMHHAFLTVKMRESARITSIVMPGFFVLALWYFLPMIAERWSEVIAFWTQKIYGAPIGYVTKNILGQTINLPYPMIEAQLPSSELVHWSFTACVIAFVLSFLGTPRVAPLIYMFRAALAIQASASIDRMVSPDFFPYNMQFYITDALLLSIYLMFILPVILGFVYYIFDFGLLRKISLTVVMIGYFIIMIPCQYMAHAYIIEQCTFLFLPLLFLLFGTLPDILMFVSIYSLGMSWHTNVESIKGRGL
ncbi:MAG: hypothetical protein SFX19_05880 [Alphaproteobacteria bacterium]|nr:hypothetical protein [Alphaproteobacteria bacterium]